MQDDCNSLRWSCLRTELAPFEDFQEMVCGRYNAIRPPESNRWGFRFQAALIRLAISVRFRFQWRSCIVDRDFDLILIYIQLKYHKNLIIRSKDLIKRSKLLIKRSKKLIYIEKVNLFWPIKNKFLFNQLDFKNVD